ncbi:MAG: YkgJ family cysteine cluster protein [Deltaproteobacteria bacterium]|nr:YkgJ family cysteine cluster protein [Nannocystaceae bacterium]
MSRGDAELALVQLRRRVDDHFAAAVTRTAEAFACHEGCAQCCGVRFGVFTVEADRVATALARLAQDDPQLRARVRTQADDPDHDACALLVDGRCSVYDERPLICRSHGLPVQRVADDGERVLEVCPLNFTASVPPPASVLVLEAVNAPLGVLARMWDGAGERIELAALARAEDLPR